MNKTRLITATIFLFLVSCTQTGPSTLSSASVSPTIISTTTPLPLSTPTMPPLEISTAPPAEPTLSPTPTLRNSNSFAAGLSEDGRFLAFTSWDNQLVGGDTNGTPDAFVYDRETGVIARVSVTNNGEELQGGNIARAISADGNFVLFSSDAGGAAAFGSDLPGALLLHNRQSGQTELLNLDSGTPNQQYYGVQGQLSADGRFVVIEAVTYGMLDRDEWNVFLIDRQTGQQKKLSQSPDQSPANGNSNTTAMTPDGRWIAFLSQASNLTPDDQPCTDTLLHCADIFVYDTTTGSLKRIPVGFGMTLGAAADRLSFSADGRWLAYNAANDQSQFQVSIYDMQTGQIESVCTTGLEGCSGHTPALSSNGNWLAFATNQVFVQNRQTGQMQQISVSSTGQPADDPSGYITLQSEGFGSDVVISGDGKWVAFTSQAANLLPDGVQKRICSLPGWGEFPCYDLFFHNRETGETRWVNIPQP